jgi:predicted phosphoadenosine phosphosulfate sulfurtransferase
VPKTYLQSNVLEAAKERIRWTFDNFDRIYCSFSAGKDSGVMAHLVCEEARARRRKIGLFFLDWEAQFSLTIEFAETVFREYADCTEPFWAAVPVKTWNACSQFEPEWTAWDPKKKNIWVRQPSELSITDTAVFPFWYEGIMFEEFVPTFGQWYAKGEKCACFVGIRTQESLNRFRSLAMEKPTLDGKQYTTNAVENVWNVYPIYDWQTQDIWVYHAKTGKPYNKLYDRMHQSGMSIHQMRICEPFGDESRKGLWLYQIIEPSIWARLVLRVNGANTGKVYSNTRGNVMGNHTITLPEGHTWESFAKSLLGSTPPKTALHYKNKIAVYLKWWMSRGYPEGIPDEADLKAENAGKAPSWRRVCKTLLRNDYWCKYLGFSPTKTSAYEKYTDLMARRRKSWGIFSDDVKVVDHEVTA